jgi:hypothetical protein
MRLTDGTTTVNVTDNGGGDANATTGKISWSGTVGLWTVDVSFGTGEGFPLTGPGGMDTTYNVSSSSGNGTTLTILFTQYDMTPSYPGWALSIGGTNTANTPVAYSAFYSNTNVPGALTTQIGSTLGPFTASGAYGGSSSGSAADVPLYSLTQRLQFRSTGSGGNTGDASLLPIPEPASMLLLGTGLVFVARRARRRRS